MSMTIIFDCKKKPKSVNKFTNFNVAQLMRRAINPQIKEGQLTISVVQYKK